MVGLSEVGLTPDTNRGVRLWRPSDSLEFEIVVEGQTAKYAVNIYAIGIILRDMVWELTNFFSSHRVRAIP